MGGSGGTLPATDWGSETSCLLRRRVPRCQVSLCLRWRRVAPGQQWAAGQKLGAAACPSPAPALALPAAPAPWERFCELAGQQMPGETCLEWESLELEGCARGAEVPGHGPCVGEGRPSSSEPGKEWCEDTFIKGLPQKYFAAFAVLYKCEPLSFCPGVLPIWGF